MHGPQAHHPLHFGRPLSLQNLQALVISQVGTKPHLPAALIRSF